jgi:hypothetical protein
MFWDKTNHHGFFCIWCIYSWFWVSDTEPFLLRFQNFVYVVVKSPDYITSHDFPKWHSGSLIVLLIGLMKFIFPKFLLTAENFWSGFSADCLYAEILDELSVTVSLSMFTSSLTFRQLFKCYFLPFQSLVYFLISFLCYWMTRSFFFRSSLIFWDHLTHMYSWSTMSFP